jgi:Ca-activated chloride channel family protein
MPTLLLVLLFALLSWPTALAQSQPKREKAPDTRTLSPYFFVKSDDPATDRLPLKATSAKAEIVGTIARVKVAQVYRNEGTQGRVPPAASTSPA